MPEAADPQRSRLAVDCPHCHVTAGTGLCRAVDPGLLGRLALRHPGVRCEVCSYDGPAWGVGDRVSLMPGSHPHIGLWLTRDQVATRARELLRERGLTGDEIAAIVLVADGQGSPTRAGRSGARDGPSERRG
jgi:hypothetical protein